MSYKLCADGIIIKSVHMESGREVLLGNVGECHANIWPTSLLQNIGCFFVLKQKLCTK